MAREGGRARASERKKQREGGREGGSEKIWRDARDETGERERE